ncbi:MAG: T9SS type A sorting domain-containing protein [Bacteroidia bacterium]
MTNSKHFMLSRLVCLALVAFLPAITAAQCGPITLVPIATGFNGMVGIDHYQPTNQIVVSVNYSWGAPNNLDLIAGNGAHIQYSALDSVFDELLIATAKDDGNGMSMGGFPAGTLVSGTSFAAEVLRVDPGGSPIMNPWVTCPGELGRFEGSFYFDRTGVFGGDLIAVSNAGGVWRINSAGQPTFLTNVGVHLEGVITMPNNLTKWGPWAGKILAGDEDNYRIWAIDANGNATPYSLGLDPEDLDLIPANMNFYGVDFASQTLRGAPASAFTCMVGDLLVTVEHPGKSVHVWWDGTQFRQEQIAQVAQWEHVTFSPAGMNPIGPTLCTTTATCTKPTPPAYQHGFDNICGYGGVSSVTLSVAAAGGPPPFTYAWSGPGTIVNGNTANPTVTPPCPPNNGTACHTYTVVVTDGSGCTATCSINLSSININCIGNTNNGNNGNNTGQSGNGVIQSVNAQQHITICHVPPGNNSIGQIKCLPVPAINDHLANHSGDYLGPCGAVPPTTGCSANRSMPGLSANPEPGKLEMQAFPNPTSGNLRVAMQAGEGATNGNLELRLMDLTGRIIAVQTPKLSSGMGEAIFDLSNIAPGTYILSLDGGKEGRLVQRIVRE